MVDSLRADKVDADELSRRIEEQDRHYLAQMEASKKKDAEIVRLQNVHRQKEDDLKKQSSKFGALSLTLKTTQDNLSSCATRLDETEISLATLQSFAVQRQPMGEWRMQM